MKLTRKKYLQSINPLEILRTKKILQHNPTLEPKINRAQASQLSLYEYNQQICKVNTNLEADQILTSMFLPNSTYWINLDILNVGTIEKIGTNIGLHTLIIEDILSENQRPKVDEIENLLTCVLHMLYYNETLNTIEGEQVSFVLGKNFLMSFQADSERDLFDPIREKLKLTNTKLRNQGPDYLLYALIDTVVDHYFVVLDKLAMQIELLEEEITRQTAGDYTMNRINNLRKEIMFFKRNTFPVRELIGGIIRSENSLIEERTNKYFKDIYDHIIQANDLCETYRDVIGNLRDLYFSQVNLKMNEVMKFLAIVTALLAPATVIGGIFGMNFERIPYLHHQNGFWIATSIMLIIPFLMLLYFKRKDWF